MSYTSDLVDSATETKDQLVSNLRRVVSDAEDLLAATAGQTDSKITELRARAKENLSMAREKLADVIELAQVRFELFTVEAREELARLAGMAVMGALAVVFVSFGLIFLAIFLTVLLWDTHRLLALGIFTSLFLGGGLVLALLAWNKAKQGFRMFGATRSELQRDQDRLRTS